MSINKRLTVLISTLVLGVSLALGLFSINVIMRIIERDTAEWMVNEAGIGAELVSARITNYQQVLRTIAAMPVVQTMDRALQGPVILPLIEEMGFDDIAIIDLEANAWHVKGGSVPNLAARDYVKTALAGGMGLSSIMTSAQSAVPIPFPILNYTVPIVRNGQVIGAVLARTNALAFSDTMKSIKGKSGGYAYMINGTGTVVAHALRPETVDSAENFIEKAKTDPSAVPMANAMREMIEGKQGSLAYTYGGKDLLCGFTSVPGQDMYIVMSAERDALLSEVYSMRTIMFIIMGAAVLAGIGASVLLARSIAGPLGKMRDVLSKMGEGDLTSEAPARGNDEIAEIGVSLNQSTGNVRSLVRTIKEQSASLSGIGDELAENMKKTETTARLITAGTEKIKTQFVDQDESVRKTSGIVEQISAGISSLSEFVEAQSASVSQSSSAIEEMLANVQSVTQTLIRNTENVEYLAQASEAGRNGLEEVSQNIQEIARESEGLLEINAVMENIASQTNLLSMNAAIEAAHAGEAGKGFAVVAGEIRKLAESSSTQSKTIAAVLKKIKSSIDKITVSTKAVLNRFQAINEGVETVARQEDLIRSSMEEQNAGSQQILEAVGRLNELTGKVKASSTNMLSGSREIIRECHNLERSTREISGGVSEMASGTEQINAAVNRVNGISIQNRESINRLTEDVSRFKIE